MTQFLFFFRLFPEKVWVGKVLEKFLKMVGLVLGLERERKVCGVVMDAMDELELVGRDD